MSYHAFSTQDSMPDNYKFLIGSILPRPIAVVSTRNADGTNNLAPFSFFTAICPKPMMIAFCPVLRSSDLQPKDTLVNIRREREFVINFCTEDNYQKVNECSQELPYGVDEFKASELTPIKSEYVKAMRMKESPIHFECKLRDILQYGKEAGSGSLITGEVIKIHIHSSVMRDGKIQTSLYRPVARGAGNDWFKSDSVFEVERLMKNQLQR